MSDTKGRETVTPALTPEQWAAYERERDDMMMRDLHSTAFGGSGSYGLPHVHELSPKALAAICLHGHLTHDHVRLLDAVIHSSDAADIPGADKDLPALRNLIASLLPPEAP